MQTFIRLLSPMSPTGVEQAVRAIAAECLPLVQLKLSPAAGQMNLSELRGYVCARARRTVAIEVRTSKSLPSNLPAWLTSEITSKSIEQITQAIVRQAMRPAVSRSLQRAA